MAGAPVSSAQTWTLFGMCVYMKNTFVHCEEPDPRKPIRRVRTEPLAGGADKVPHEAPREECLHGGADEVPKEGPEEDCPLGAAEEVPKNAPEERCLRGGADEVLKEVSEGECLRGGVEDAPKEDPEEDPVPHARRITTRRSGFDQSSMSAATNGGSDGARPQTQEFRAGITAPQATSSGGPCAVPPQATEAVDVKHTPAAPDQQHHTPAPKAVAAKPVCPHGTGRCAFYHRGTCSQFVCKFCHWCEPGKYQEDKKHRKKSKADAARAAAKRASSSSPKEQAVDKEQTLPQEQAAPSTDRGRKGQGQSFAPQQEPPSSIGRNKKGKGNEICAPTRHAASSNGRDIIHCQANRQGCADMRQWMPQLWEASSSAPNVPGTALCKVLVSPVAIVPSVLPPNVLLFPNHVLVQDLTMGGVQVAWAPPCAPSSAPDAVPDM